MDAGSCGAAGTLSSKFTLGAHGAAVVIDCRMAWKVVRGEREACRTGSGTRSGGLLLGNVQTT